MTAGLAAQAETSLPALFADHMVLQREKPVPVWGWAAPGETVAGEFVPGTGTGQPAQKKSATAGKDGRWQVALDPLKAAAEGGTLTVQAGANQPRIVHDVLVGEVWICSGQSNMGFPVKKVTNAAPDIAAADDPLLRLFGVKWKVMGEPQRDVGGKWDVADPKTVAEFSGVAYYFGRELRQELKVPVGLVQSACDWTPAEAWMSREGLSADPDIKAAILDRWDRIAADHPAKMADYDRKHAEWAQAKSKADAEKTAAPPAPKAPADPNFIHRATGLFNGGIAPLIPYAMRGAIWYQGETNDGRAHQYRRLFPLLIRDWRRSWGPPPSPGSGGPGSDFPFLFVQLSSVGPLQSLPVVDPVWAADWAEVRDSQLAGLALTNTAMAVTIDLGDGEIHPANKRDVGKRLALAARAVAYGQAVAYKGPMYQAMTVEDGKVRLSFADIGGGLVARGQGVAGFTIAGEDRQFVPAAATIAGDTVVVSSEKVAKPAAVRYAWGNNPPFSLYNKDGLPASPFRTDDWPCNTYGKTSMFVEQ
jgi:sialate O-acetylesterase